jgi:hypothetical protein
VVGVTPVCASFFPRPLPLVIVSCGVVLYLRLHPRLSDMHMPVTGLPPGLQDALRAAGMGEFANPLPAGASKARGTAIIPETPPKHGGMPSAAPLPKIGGTFLERVPSTPALPPAPGGQRLVDAAMRALSQVAASSATGAPSSSSGPATVQLLSTSVRGGKGGGGGRSDEPRRDHTIL